MKKVKDSQKRWKQLVTMLLVAALLVTGTPDVVGFASEGTQEQVTAAAEQSQKTQEKAQKESVQEETAQKEAVQDHEQMSEEAGGQQSSSSHSDTAVKEENTEKERSAAGTTERSETEEPQNNKQKNEVVSGAKSVAPSTSKVREPDKNEEKKEEKEEKDTKTEYIYKSASIYAKITLKDQYGKRKTINVQVKKKLKKATNKNVTVKVVEGNKDYVKLELNNKSDQCIFVAYPYYLIVKNGEKKEYVSKKEILNSRRPPISLAPGSKVRIGVSLTNYNMIEGLTYKIECEVFTNLQEIGIADYEITTTFCYK